MGIANYLKDTRGELRHVSWPTRKQAIVFTVTVIAFSLLVAVLLGAFDVAFNYLLRLVLN